MIRDTFATRTRESQEGMWVIARGNRRSRTYLCVCAMRDLLSSASVVRCGDYCARADNLFASRQCRAEMRGNVGKYEVDVGFVRSYEW